MSNHGGGYLLNDVLRLMDEHLVFQALAENRRREVVREVVDLACEEHGCDPGEILDGLGQRFGICSCCLEPAEELVDDLCRACSGEGRGRRLRKAR
jgi:hypothetical protein